MAEYAQALGVAKKDILLEERSLSTIGNFYFTKQLYLVTSRLYNLLVITCQNHLPKAEYIAKKVLGPKFSCTFLLVRNPDPSVSKGHGGLSEIRRYLRQIKNGDDKAIAELLGKHPYYQHYRKF